MSYKHQKNQFRQIKLPVPYDLYKELNLDDAIQEEELYEVEEES